MIQYIYTLTDPIDLKIKYIGKTNNIKRRLKQHMLPSCLKFKNYKNNWLKKLKSNGTKPIIEILDEGNDVNIDTLEQYWISQFKAWGFNLKNMTDGGNSGVDWTGKKHKEVSKMKLKMCNLKKVIYQYDINTNDILDKFLSTHDIKKILGFDRKSVSNCCKGIKYSNVVGGYYFRYENEYFPLIKSRVKREVVQYDLDGNIIGEFESINSASQNIYNQDKIRRFCNREYKSLESLYGFVWKYKSV